jgi:hypothetical protein
VRDWLETRGRRILSLLSDLGGALGFVVAAVALIAAAVSGAVLLAVTAFPQPFLSFLILGVALLAAGLALHFLRDRLVAPPAASGEIRSLDFNNPLSQAAALQRQHDAKKPRKALRRVLEELRDDRRYVQRASEGDISQIREIGLRAWYDEEETLLELADPAPHSSARHAYRELEGIRDVLYYRESATTLTLRKQPKDLLETDVQTTFEAIDAAIETLRAADQSLQAVTQ